LETTDDYIRAYAEIEQLLPDFEAKFSTSLPTLGMTLRKIRKEKGLSLVAVARQAGLSKLTVIRIESGRSHPLPRTVQKLAAALGISDTVSNFLGRSRNPCFTLGYPGSMDRSIFLGVAMK
jgi:DNA-binding XRE family transcriptional regulator